ncbi:MAG: IS630 family transposase, partial [Terriglobales bacterium]
MAMGRPKAVLVLSPEQRAQLESMASSRSLPAGLHDELRPGRPRPISDERVAQLVRKTLDTKPKGGTHWSVRQ